MTKHLEGMGAERIADIRARLAAATPGPWVLHFRADERTKTQYSWSIWDAEGNKFVLDMERKQQPPSDEWVKNKTADLDFVAHTPTDISELLTELDRVTAENASLRTMTDGLAGALKALMVTYPEGYLPGGKICVQVADAMNAYDAYISTYAKSKGEG